MKIINYCDHAVAVTVDGVTWVKPRNRDGLDARVYYDPENSVIKDDDSGVLIPVKYKTRARVMLFPGHINFPKAKEGVVYLVSGQVRDFLSQRKDLYSPNSGPSAERRGGQVISVKELIGNV